METDLETILKTTGTVISNNWATLFLSDEDGETWIIATNICDHSFSSDYFIYLTTKSFNKALKYFLNDDNFTK